MLKAILIIVVVVGMLVGGLLTLRRSSGMGMPDDAVLKRAKQREHDIEEAEKKEKEEP